VPAVHLFSLKWLIGGKIHRVRVVGLGLGYVIRESIGLLVLGLGLAVSVRDMDGFFPLINGMCFHTHILPHASLLQVLNQ